MLIPANFNATFHDLPLNGSIIGKHDHIHGRYLKFETALQKADDLREMKLAFDADKDGES